MKRTLSDCIPEETVLRLTEEAFENAGAERKPARTAPRLLALAASLAVIVTALNFDTVYAAVRELLYFLPGSGAVSQEPVEYWLPDREYSARVGNASYFVTYLYRRGDTLAVGVELKATSDPEYRESSGSGNGDWLALLTDEEKLKLAAGESLPDQAPCENRAPIADGEKAELVVTETERDHVSPLTDEEKLKLLEEQKNKLAAGEIESDGAQVFDPSEGPQSHSGEAPAREGPYSHPEFIDPPESRPYDPAVDGPIDGPVNLPAPVKEANGVEISFLDEAGNPIDLEHTGHNSSRVIGMGELEAQEALEVEGFTYEKFTLVVNEYLRFPVELHRVAPEDYALTKSAVAEDAGYRVSLLPLNENCTRFALIPEPVGEQGSRAPKGTYWNPMTFDIRATGEDGRTYEAEAVNSRPGCQEYYIPEMPQTRIREIALTGILESTRYEKPPAVLTIPALELGEIKELDQRLDLWNFSVEVLAAGLKEDGTLWVKMKTDCEEGVRLNQLDLDWPTEKGLSLTHTLEEGSQTIAAHDMGHRAGKKTRLPVTYASVVREGEWRFIVPEFSSPKG